MPIEGPKLAGPARLHDLLGEAAHRRPDDRALVSGADSWSWATLERDVHTLAAHLVAMGLRQGDRVAALLPNCGALLVVYLGCLKAGLVVTPLNYRYTPASIDHALAVSGARLLVAHAERGADIAASARAQALPLGLVAVDGAIDGAKRLDTLLAAAPPPTTLPKPDPDATAFLFFTSGSTGKPKGVMHSIASFGAISASFAQALGLTSDDIVFPGGSISHVGSLSAAFAAFSVGAPVVLARGFDAGRVLDLLRRERPTVLVTLPAALMSLQHDHDARAADFASLRLCITGGDKFPDDHARDFAALTGLAITETYGLTEATDCLLNPPDAARPGSVGQVSPGYAAAVRDDSGREAAEGRLWLRGSPLFQGYWNDPDATAQAMLDGWFDTGDVMRVDAEGYFWFRGRRKQIIVHDGSNIAPQEVEEAVMHHQAVALAGAAGVHDALHGENVWAFVSLKTGAARPPVQEIIEAARQQIGYKAPERVIILPDIPLNAAGKVDRMALKEQAAQHLAGGRAP
ncbi:MAG: class I adenylate-forming enzyme family protein [Pseudomonadota bacterium]